MFCSFDVARSVADDRDNGGAGRAANTSLIHHAQYISSAFEKLIRPLLHDGTALFKKVGTLVRLNDRIANGVHQRLLGELVIDSDFCAPISEC